MIRFVRTNSSDQNFVNLVKQLDAYLSIIDGEDHSFYKQYNGIENLKYVIVAFDQDVAVGCGAIKEFDATSVEVKRMFVLPSSRGKGLARQILVTLEQWAKELGYRRCVLETGKRMPDAVMLYKNSGYEVVENFGPYTQMDNSICFGKSIE